MPTSPPPDGFPRPSRSATNPEEGMVLIEIYRRMPGWRKLQQVCHLNWMADIVALADIRRRHPHAGPHELRMRLVSRRLGAEDMRRVFGWDPEKEGC